MPTLTVSGREGFRALLIGLSFYATGGGGSWERGWKIVNEVYIAKSRSLILYDIDEVNETIVSAYMVGSMARSASHQSLDAVRVPLARALSTLRRRVGVNIGAIAPVELGAGNTPVAFLAASLANVPVVDGDRVGRAAPEIHQDTLNIYGLSLAPSAVASRTGSLLVLYEYASIDEYEHIVRSLAASSGSSVAVVDAPLGPEEARRALIRGSISRAFELGARVLEARATGSNPLDALLEACRGWLVFEGVVEDTQLSDNAGFLEGYVTIKGIDASGGRELKVWVKNEYIMAWLDGEPIVMPPDIISLVDSKAELVLVTRLRPGLHVYVVAARAHEAWRTPRGLELFGPRHFGFTYDYKPVETLVAAHGTQVLPTSY
ncbi:hypothetical protein Pyrde_0812 [Pyrodictium delaneyi]|uniref:DUF917 domain-containing protein n=1 Tax=Pyrodictium delaneyi TaxID=1273541 RepID=A0A0P0N2T0_9CREN|nr:DUF917 domain-containing protein [Pyrodictium delaneyi]ALL00862.1 hypothetical protein Pyrde_0812 [Pyrodictium delaneyi]OWJ55512.1 hypothetical protein Pdsh_01585 [Pyrodictium delaneyi]